MAQDITLLGASYSAVPAVVLPKTGGGSASFTDVTDTTAAAEDVASGKYFYTASGERTAGTASGGGDNLPTFISRGSLGSYTFSDSSVPDYCFYQSKFESLSLPNLQTMQKDAVFRGATIGNLNLPNLEVCRNNFFDGLKTASLSLPKLATCGQGAFQYCTASSLSLPKFVNATGQTAFKEMTNLTSIDLPLCTTPGNYAFERCTSLALVDFGVLSQIPQGLFNYCTALSTLILRNTNLVSLANVNAFNNMGGRAVTVYVPQSLVNTYPTASNWVNVTGATLTFAAIEGSQYE